MRILQIFNQYRFRGGEEAWVDGIPALLGDSAVVGELRFYSDDWTKKGAPSKLSQIFLMGDNPESRKQLRDHVERFLPDVLLFHNVIPVGSFGLFQEAKALGIPVLNYIHNFRPFSPSGTLWDGSKVIDAALHGNSWPEIFSGAWQGSRIKTAILAAHLKNAINTGLLDCINQHLAISHFMKDCFIEAGVPEEKITVLRHCWAGEINEHFKEEEMHYLFIGRLVAEKGVSTLIEAWKILAQKLGDACPELVIAGTGPEEENLKEAAEDLPHIRFTGFIEGEVKKQVIQQCRALLAPALWWEPLGLNVYEAFAYRRPVVAAKSGALQETVQNGINGWLHRAGDAKDLADVIIDAEKSGKNERRKRGAAGHKWLQHNANTEDWKNQFMRIVSQLQSSLSTRDSTLS